MFHLQNLRFFWVLTATSLLLSVSCALKAATQWCIFRAGREDVSGRCKWPEKKITIANTKGNDEEGGGCQQVWQVLNGEEDGPLLRV